MEAASSSSDNDSSTSSSEEEVALSRREVSHSRRTEEGDDESDSDQDDGSSAEDDSSSQASSSSDEDSSCNEEEESREALLPLAERIKREQAKGVDLKDRRERKQRALKVATERLHKSKKEREQKQNSSEDKTSMAKTKKKRKSKHAPTEVSSKREDFYRRKLDLNENGIGVAIGAHRYKPRDPRLSNLNGHLDMEHFEKNYAFLQDMRQKEITDLKKRISARKATGTKGTERRRRLGITNDRRTLEDDKEELKRLLHEKAELERRQIERASKRSVKKRLQQEVADGKRGVYFPKRKELRKLHLEAKYEEIRRMGGDKAVDRAVAKRRKKNKSKDAGLLGGSSRG